jgi:hypothetical protein
LKVLVSSGRIYRQAQLSFRCVQMFLGFCAVAVHIVVIGCASAFHFVDRLDDVLVNIVKVVPVMNPLRTNHAGNERQADRRYSKCFPHG